MSSYGFVEREIEGLTRFIAKTVLQKDIPSKSIIDENGVLSEAELLEHTLMNMLLNGRINEAENILFDYIRNDPNPLYLSLAMKFYDNLSRMDDSTLEHCNFSKEEVIDGMAEIKKLYAIK